MTIGSISSPWRNFLPVIAVAQWRSLRYEEIYLNAYASVAEAKAGIGSWLGFYNEERQHQSLGYRTPRQALMKQSARGYGDDRLCRAAAPSPTSPPAPQPTTEAMLTRKKRAAMP
jgi:transposase InsO family protein